MKNAIREIISEIPTGVIFDTHSIIIRLVQSYSDIYLSNFNSGTTETYHGRIGQNIASFEGEIIERQGTSWSKNIRDNFSPCTCWVKL
jgi:hypothetical protein